MFRKESGNDLKAAMKNHEDIHTIPRFTGVRFMGENKPPSYEKERGKVVLRESQVSVRATR